MDYKLFSFNDDQINENKKGYSVITERSSIVDEISDISSQIPYDQENVQLYNEIYDRLTAYNGNIDGMLVNTGLINLLFDSLNVEDPSVQFACFRLISQIASKTNSVITILINNIEFILGFIANPDFLVEICKIIQVIVLNSDQSANFLIQTQNILSILSSCIIRNKGTIRYMALFRTLYVILDRASKECLQAENEEGVLYESIPVECLKMLFYTDKPEILEYILLCYNVLIKKTKGSVRDFFDDSFFKHCIDIIEEVFTNEKFQNCRIPITKVLQKLVDYSVLSDSKHAEYSINKVMSLFGKNPGLDGNLIMIIQTIQDNDFVIEYLMDNRMFEKFVLLWLDNFNAFAREALIPIVLRAISFNTKKVLETDRFINVLIEISESLEEFSLNVVGDILHILLIAIKEDLEIREEFDPEELNKCLDGIIASENKEASSWAKILKDAINVNEEEENYEDFVDKLCM